MRLRLTKSRSSSVPLHSIDSRSGVLKHKYERSPRISIITDAADIHSIAREIRTIVRDERRVVRDFSEWSKSRGSSDACLVWFAGERLLEGTAGVLLKSLHSQNRRSFVVVNTPCVEEVPSLTLQPRIFAGAASVDHWSFQIRIESRATPTRAVADSSRPDEPWAKLVEAISFEKGALGAGVEPLLRLWESRDKFADVVAALVLRNLVAVMLRHQESSNTKKFLEAGVKLYPTYAELHYLSALLAIREQRFAEALPLLERAKACGIVFPGSGGENSYRCDWLLGVLAARVGDDRRAFQYFLAGVKCNPPFEPFADGASQASPSARDDRKPAVRIHAGCAFEPSRGDEDFRIPSHAWRLRCSSPNHTNHSTRTISRAESRKSTREFIRACPRGGAVSR